MKLNELLNYNDIVIQCHDNPDADALASGYGLFNYLKKNGKSPSFIYRGRNRVTKSNLSIMMDELSVPVSYEPDFDRVPELLVTVDCQYGQRNVTTTPAKNIAVIDHHQTTVQLPPLSEVRSNIGSCSTVIWSMMIDEGFDIRDDKKLSTALYYGLYTDTNCLSEISHPLDRDMIDSLDINNSIITSMKNSNISLDELKLTGNALSHGTYHTRNRIMLTEVDECDPNILGLVSDLMLETEGIDICIAYMVKTTEIKLSVRSCIKEVHANELAEFITKGLGGGGGHLIKAGGTIRPEKLLDIYPDLNISDITFLKDFTGKFLYERTFDYMRSYELMYSETTNLDISNMQLYQKRPVELGFVKTTDLCPSGTQLEVRTLEGDIHIISDDDTYIMIGIEGEVYPIKKAKFEASYRTLGKPYSGDFDYEPSVHDPKSGQRRDILEFSDTCISTGTSFILAKPLERNIRLFTKWDEERYYTGHPGDYIACRRDDPHDIYIIKGSLFERLYC